MQGKRLLVVDDDPSVLKFVAKVAASMEYDLVSCGDGLDALLAFGDGSSIDALVTDIKMPGVTGFQLAQSLREKRPELPVLFISGYFEAAEVPQELGSVPGTHLLAKPFSPQKLGQALLLLFAAAGLP
jgi:CheY-like chemotaxis protein